MKNILRVGLGLLVSVSFAYAEVEKFEFRIHMNGLSCERTLLAPADVLEQFKKTGMARYDIVKQVLKTHISYSGTGVAGMLAQQLPAQHFESGQIPGKEFQGHYFVKLERESSGQVYMLVGERAKIETPVEYDAESVKIAAEQGVDITDQTIKFDIENVNRTRVEFTSGSWEDYLAGKEVQFRQAEEKAMGMEKALGQSIDAMVSPLSQQFTQMLSIVPGVTVGNIEFLQRGSSSLIYAVKAHDMTIVMTPLDLVIRIPVEMRFEGDDNGGSNNLN